MAGNLTEGGILRTLVATAVPSMIGFGAMMLFDLVDIFWLGKISSTAVAGVTVFSALFWIIEALNEVIGMSSVSLISQAFGSGDRERTNLTIEQTIAFKFVAASVAALLLALFLKPVMLLLVNEETASLGLEYGYIRIFLLPIMFSSYSVNTTLRCIGDTAGSMKIMLLANLLNAILDPVLMFETIPYFNIPGFGLGVFGAAVATVVTQAFAFLLGFYLIFSGGKGVKPSLARLFRLDGRLAVRFMTIGLPNGLEVLLRNSSSLLIIGFVGAYGTQAIAASGIVARLINFIIIPLIGLSIAGSVMTGQALGAGNEGRAKETAGTVSLFGLVVMCVVMALSIPFGRYVLGIFTQDSGVLSYGSEFLIYATAGLVFQGWKTGRSAAFAGSGYNLPHMVGSLISRWGMQVPAAFVCSSLLRLPIVWIWISFLLADIVELAVTTVFFRHGGWARKRV